MFQSIGKRTLTGTQTLLFERLGINDTKSRIIAACNATEYFMASIIAIFIIDRIGRRKLMLFGATGQCLTMVLLAVLGSISNSAARVVSAVLLFVFNSFFAVGWLGMTWLYVRRISTSLPSFPFNHSFCEACRDYRPSRQRSSQCSFDGTKTLKRFRNLSLTEAQASNWTWNFLVVMITGPSFANIQWRTYIGTPSCSFFA